MLVDLSKQRPHSELPDINLLDLAGLSSKAPAGNFLELGVYKGGSAWVLNEVAKTRGSKLFLFDTFTGLPRESTVQEIPSGRFNDTSVAEVQANIPEAIIFSGLFPQSLTPEVNNLAFVHVDCDLLNGCTAALSELWPLMVSGGIMAFDDWGFESIHVPVKNKFGGSIKFTVNQIPYAVKD